MKKVFLYLCIFLIFFSLKAFANEEEVLLDIDSTPFSVQTEEVKVIQNENEQELTLFEKIKNTNAKEITDYNVPNYLLGDVLNKEFKSGIVENIHLFAVQRSDFSMNIAENDSDFNYGFTTLYAGINGGFKDKKTYYEALFRVNGQHLGSFLQFMPSNLYIATTAVPHHTILFGNSRTPTGYEGGQSMLTLPFVARSQVARNFGNVRKVGLRVKGNYSLIDYDFGGYDSDTYFHSFFPGAEFTGLVNFKPLGKTDGKFGTLNFGGSLSTGHNDINYFVSGLHAGYQYKKFGADFEYMTANGYNGANGVSNKHAEGFYTTAHYMLTPKIQLLARFDEFIPNKNNFDDKRREYTAGLNWFIKGQGLRVMLNYVFCQNDKAADSHKIILGTQILL